MNAVLLTYEGYALYEWGVATRVSSTIRGVSLTPPHSGFSTLT